MMEARPTYETIYVRRRFVATAKVDGNSRSQMPEYRIWTGMIARCTNPKQKSFKHYGGRGITVCDRWRDDFENFYRDMGPRPSPRHSIDRIDNDQSYEPRNCRWATPREQVLNRRAGQIASAWGDAEVATLRRMYLEYYPIADIAVALNRSEATIRLRCHYERLRRDAHVSRLVSQHSELRPIISASGKEAFLAAVSDARRVRRQIADDAFTANRVRIETAASEIMAATASRGEKMRRMREAGLSLSEIGAHFGITRERVRQLEQAGFDAADIIAVGGARKISDTKPESRRKHINRLCRAWNRASREARMMFMEACPHSLYADLSVEQVEATPTTSAEKGRAA